MDKNLICQLAIGRGEEKQTQTSINSDLNATGKGTT